jgi:hypothetical protein
MHRIERALTTGVAVAALLLAAVACKQKTTTTVASPGPSAAGQFELVGRVTSVTLGVQPTLAVPTLSPSPSPTDMPSQTGSVKVTVQSSSDQLRSICGTRPGDSVTVFWLMTTRFDPGSVIGDLQAQLSGSHISAQGRVFTTSTAASPAAVGTASASPAAATSASPSASPAPTPTGTGVSGTVTSCTLVADHVEVSQGTVVTTPGATVAPAATRSPTPSPSPLRTTSFPPGITRTPSPSP